MADPRSPSHPTRRRWLAQAAAASAAGLLPAGARLAWSAPAAAEAPRLVLVLLRGGLDGLSAVPAPGDAAFAAARGPLAQTAEPALPLGDGFFALHPALARLQALYQQQELLVLHAVGLPYRERSHFDAQQLLESGGQRPFDLDSGWLGRALAQTGGPAARGMAFQPAVPLALRGHAGVDTWTPTRRDNAPPEALADLAGRVGRLYAQDGLLAPAFERAWQLHSAALPTLAPGMAGMGAMAPGGAAAIARWAELGRQAARFIAAPDGPQATVLEMGGWDSHANQNNQLANGLANLDALLGMLRDGLAASASGGNNVWQRSLVLVVTEFGRTVTINGTQGTDHGSGAAAFVLGGAVAGGRVLADWPGLAPAQRFEGRDLRASTDLRALFKTALHLQLQRPLAQIHRELLPGSEGLPLLPLLRG